MPNRPLAILIAGVTAISFGSIASAQASTQAPAAKPAAATPKPIPRTEVVQQISVSYKAVDTNGDGSLTASEIAAAQTKAQQAAAQVYAKRVDDTFRQLDTNKDGQLSVAEFKAGSPMPQRAPADPAKIVSELDSNKDQKVSMAEFGATALANFDKADTNRDGIVSPAEAQSARTSRR